MKTKIIGALVGGLILFIWQFLSWAMLNIHSPQMNYTENEQAILNVLSENLTEGEYILPGMPPNISKEAANKIQQANIGKPWAVVKYHNAMSANFGMNMFRGVVINILIVWFLIWILSNFRELNFKITFISALMIGVIGYLSGDYLYSIWFQNNTIPDLIDAVVSYSLLGVWLGWWMNR